MKLSGALQPTNFLRDVAEDWRRGRLCFPLDELKAFGLPVEYVGDSHIDNRWEAFIRFKIARAKANDKFSLLGIGLLSPQGRLAVAAAAS